MSDFTKTLIVDSSLQNPSPPYFKTIKEAVEDNNIQNNGGVIIVEQGTYTLDQEDDHETTNTNTRTTVYVPTNVTIIGRGNAVIEVTKNIPAFKNSAFTEGSNENITISGFKIVVKFAQGKYSEQVIDLRAVSKCLIEKLYITYDQDDEQLQGMDYWTAAAISINHNESSRVSKDIVISKCSIVDFGKIYADEGYDDKYYGMSMLLHKKCERIIIKNNYCYKTFGLYCEDVNHSTISGNIFNYGQQYMVDQNTPKGGNGIVIKGDYNSIIGNQLNHNESHGIYLGGTSNCTVTGNVCSYNYNHSIPHGPKAGIKANSPTAKFNTISGNSCYGNGQGIVLHGQIDVPKDGPSYNTVMGNNCCNNEYGIYLYEITNNNLIVGNMCNPNDDHDIYLKDGCEDNNFADNIGIIEIEEPA